MKEIEVLSSRGVQYCMLTDDHFGGDHERLHTLCDMIVERGHSYRLFRIHSTFYGKIWN